MADDSARGVYVAAIDQDAELRVIESTFQVYALVALATLATMAIVGWFVAGRLLPCCGLAQLERAERAV